MCSVFIVALGGLYGAAGAVAVFGADGCLVCDVVGAARAAFGVAGQVRGTGIHPSFGQCVLDWLGIAGAMAPYLTVVLRGIDPRWPFALSSLALVLATFGILWAERTLKSGAVPAGKTVPEPTSDVASKPRMAPFLVAMALLGMGFQIHSSLNSAPQYLRFAKPADLEFLLPVFWIGFSVLMLVSSRLSTRYSGLLVMGVAGCVGALATYAATLASTLELLLAAQFVAGGAWGVLMMSAFTSALVIGRTGREGLVTGTMFSLLALAAFTRIALVSSQWNKDAQFAPLLAWLPALVWTVAGLLLLASGRAQGNPRDQRQ